MLYWDGNFNGPTIVIRVIYLFIYVFNAQFCDIKILAILSKKNGKNDSNLNQEKHISLQNFPNFKDFKTIIAKFAMVILCTNATIEYLTTIGIYFNQNLTTIGIFKPIFNHY
jgi:hypothetical protein